MRLIELNEGNRKVLMEGTLDEIVKFLKENEELYDWTQDEDPDVELPNLDEIETMRELDYELSKVDLSWWALELE